MGIPDQNMIMNLNILAATIRSFKMLIDYTLDLTPPFSPCPHHSPKRKRRRRNCFKIPTSTGIVVAHVVIANTPSKFFHLHLETNFLSVKSKEMVGNSWTVLSYFGSQISSQSLNEVYIYQLQPKSATKGDFFHIFLSLIVSRWCHG